MISRIFFPTAAAATLSSPTGTTTGATTASGTVSTDTGSGTLYYYASTNTSESSATIKASGSSQAVSATGTQNVTFTGLSEATTYYAHYVQDTGTDSNVVSSSSFLTYVQVWPNGQISVSQVEGDDAGTTNLHTYIDDLFGTATDYLVNSSATDGTLSLDFENTPADFGSMGTLTIRADVQATNVNDDSYVLGVKITHATSGDLTDTVTLGTEADTTRTQRTLTFTLTGAGSSATKTEWDAAYLSYTWDNQPVNPPDTIGMRLYSNPIEFSYTAGVSGSGALTSTQSTLSGAGTLTHSGSGALTSDQATISGSGKREHSGTGDLTASQSTISGSGTVGVAVTGSGALTSPQSTLSGAGKREHEGIGSLSISNNTISGSGSVNHFATGSLETSNPTISGAGKREHTGTGALTSEVSTLSGQGKLTHVGSGALTSEVSTLSGNGIVSAGLTGFGSLQANSPTISGSGTVVSTRRSVGGWLFWKAWEEEQDRRRKEKEDIKEKESVINEINDEIEKELAIEQRKIDKEEQRIKELERLTNLVESYTERENYLDENVIIAVNRAINQRNYSAMEAMERLIARQKEEEEFLIEAARIILAA